MNCKNVIFKLPVGGLQLALFNGTCVFSDKFNNDSKSLLSQTELINAYVVEQLIVNK